jgi:hypothetical protein
MENLPKPKGMHWATFNRHLEAMERGAEMRDAWMFLPNKTLERLINRYGPRVRG